MKYFLAICCDCFRHKDDKSSWKTLNNKFSKKFQTHFIFLFCSGFVLSVNHIFIFKASNWAFGSSLQIHIFVIRIRIKIYTFLIIKINLLFVILILDWKSVNLNALNYSNIHINYKYNILFFNFSEPLNKN